MCLRPDKYNGHTWTYLLGSYVIALASKSWQTKAREQDRMRYFHIFAKPVVYHAITENFYSIIKIYIELPSKCHFKFSKNAYICSLDVFFVQWMRCGRWKCRPKLIRWVHYQFKYRPNIVSFLSISRLQFFCLFVFLIKNASCTKKTNTFPGWQN